MGEPIKIALLGLGVVGTGVLDILASHQEKIQTSVGCSLTVTKALVRPEDQKREIAETYDVETVTDISEILEDPEIQIVVEVIGRIEPAKTYITAALQAGKHVVTANKDLVALHGNELATLAQQEKRNFYYEASVAGGIPILRTIANSLAADEITAVLGIVNGTTNYMLTKMVAEGLTYEESLKQAQELGFAESDPTNDVDGIDAAYKMIILSKFAFGMSVPMDKITIQGIRGLAVKDVETANQLNYTIKLVGSIKKQADTIAVDVSPMLLPNTHPLAAVHNEFNGIFVKSSGIGESMYYGPGAGAKPTATSIVADLMTIVNKIQLNIVGHRFAEYTQPTKITAPNQVTEKYFLSLEMADEAGRFLRLAEIASEADVSFEQVLQEKAAEQQARVVIITHAMSAATLENIKKQIQLEPMIKLITTMKVMEG